MKIIREKYSSAHWLDEPTKRRSLRCLQSSNYNDASMALVCFERFLSTVRVEELEQTLKMFRVCYVKNESKKYTSLVIVLL